MSTGRSPISFSEPEGGVDYRRPLREVLTTIADNAFYAVFSAFPDRDYILDADYHFILDAAARELLPAEVYQKMQTTSSVRSLKLKYATFSLNGNAYLCLLGKHSTD